MVFTYQQPPYAVEHLKLYPASTLDARSREILRDELAGWCARVGAAQMSGEARLSVYAEDCVEVATALYQLDLAEVL